MSQQYECSDPDQRSIGLINAGRAIQSGELVVLPTDTVYGVGADAFDPDAVAGLVAAKGRGRAKPPPVFVGTLHALDGVATDIPEAGRRLVEEFWPGALTLVCHEQPSLVWDLGEAQGTVAVRMPDHQLALDLLEQTGPLAVTSANRTGWDSATTVEEARNQLGEKVAVYLDDGPTKDTVPSTIVDLTHTTPRVLRLGAIS
ncbi:MAG TPA: L-threonylcarbamoyladenylate synthase, partial [Actinopolymorphaceae bacterium]